MHTIHFIVFAAYLATRKPAQWYISTNKASQLFRAEKKWTEVRKRTKQDFSFGNREWNVTSLEKACKKILNSTSSHFKVYSLSIFHPCARAMKKYPNRAPHEIRKHYVNGTATQKFKQQTVFYYPLSISEWFLTNLGFCAQARFPAVEVVGCFTWKRMGI